MMIGAISSCNTTTRNMDRGTLDQPLLIVNQPTPCFVYHFSVRIEASNP
jgi:hypothetical protein